MTLLFAVAAAAALIGCTFSINIVHTHGDGSSILLESISHKGQVEQVEVTAPEPHNE